MSGKAWKNEQALLNGKKCYTVINKLKKNIVQSNFSISIYFGPNNLKHHCKELESLITGYKISASCVNF